MPLETRTLNETPTMSNLSTWDPFRDLHDLHHRLNTLFPSAAPKRGELAESALSADWVPAVDIVEDDTQYTIKADLPDIKREDVKVSVENGVLTISGERKHESETTDKKKKYHRIERSYGRYVRSFRLPEEVKPDQVEAKFQDGVLTVRLPKAEEAKKPAAVQIPVS
jgi:HSP20 family protein